MRADSAARAQRCAASGSGTLSDGNDASCTTAANGDCTCESSVPAKIMDSGIYKVQGKQLELGAARADFRVQGKQLVMLPTVAMPIGSMAEMTSQLQITLQKQ